MLLTSLVRLFENENNSVLFHVFENENNHEIMTFNKTATSVFTTYKDLEVENFVIDYDEQENSYDVRATIDVFEAVAYKLEYNSLHDNCTKNIDLSFYYIDNLREAFEDCNFKTDFDTFVRSIFTYNA